MSSIAPYEIFFSVPVIPIDSFTNIPSLPLIPLLSQLLMLSIPISLLLLISYHYEILLYPDLFSPLRHLPTAPQPFFLTRLFREPNATTFTRWIDTVPNNGLIRYKGLLNAERLLISSPEALRAALPSASIQGRNFDESPDRNGRQPRFKIEKAPLDRAALEAFAGPGLVSVEGHEHRVQRGQVAQALSYRNTKSLLPSIEAKAQDFLAKLQRLVRENSKTAESGASIDLSNHATALLLDLATLSILGRDFNCLYAYTETSTNLITPISTAVRLLTAYRPSFTLRASATKMRFLLLHIFPSRLVGRLPSFLVPGTSSLACTRATAVDIATPFVREHCASRPPQAEAAQSAEPPPSLLSHFPKSEGQRKLATQSATLLAASHESTATTLTAVLALLSHPRHAYIQNRLRQELLEQSLTSQNPSSSSSSSSSSSPYLKAVIAETLRLYPAFPTLGRRIPTNPEGIMIAGERVPQSTYLVVSPWALHRDKATWGADAETFRPERWLQSEGTGNDDGSLKQEQRQQQQQENNVIFTGPPRGAVYIPFGAGARACPGERWARDVLRTVVSGVVKDFELESDYQSGSSSGSDGCGNDEDMGRLRVGGAATGGLILADARVRIRRRSWT